MPDATWAEWLSGSLNGAATHHVAPWAAWHARCMVVAWVVLLPLGALAARFFKVLPRQAWPQQLDNKAWWHGHRLLQWAGVAVLSLGAALAWRQGLAGSGAARAHAAAGWVLVAAAWLQVLSGQLRGSKGGPGEPKPRGDHYDMTARRIAFERGHKALGWGCIVAALFVAALGLWLVGAPRWLALALAAWSVFLVAGFAHLQRSGRCIDTYQAIWGPGLEHPGNRINPIGWGVLRPGTSGGGPERSV